MEKNKSLLIVDDDPLNRKMLGAVLLQNGFHIVEASSGEEAIGKAGVNTDLILLDIMMAGMDGFETCRCLKASAHRDIPVVFLSAIQDPELKAVGFESGGVDFVSKPFESAELLARIRSQIMLREQRNRLADHAARLAKIADERTRQLIHADRLATLGTFSASIVHEINNPNMVISGSAELLIHFWRHAKPILEQYATEDETGRVSSGLKNVADRLKAILKQTERITKFTESLKTYAYGSGDAKEVCLAAKILSDTLDLVRYRMLHGIEVSVNVLPDTRIYGDPQKITQVFVNLINNAMDAMENKTGHISIDAIPSEAQTVFRVCDDGPGISYDISERIFDAFYTTKEKTKGTGLGLYIVREIIEEHGGSIALIRRNGPGCEFEIRLPAHH